MAHHPQGARVSEAEAAGNGREGNILERSFMPQADSLLQSGSRYWVQQFGRARYAPIRRITSEEWPETPLARHIPKAGFLLTGCGAAVRPGVRATPPTIDCTATGPPL